MAVEQGDIYPGTNERIVGIVYPEGGGRILQGERGGVFAEGNAKFHGSYFGIDPIHRNDPNRRFTGIELLEGGGYRSITSNPNEGGYAFNAPARPTPSASTTPAPLTAAQQRAAAPGAMSAKGELVSVLASYGLPASLADRLWDDEYINKGTPIGTITSVVLPETNEYRQRFPGLTALRERQRQGEPVIIPSVGEYVQLESGIRGVMRDAGLPAGLFDEPGELATFIGGSVSPKEVEDRIAYAKQQVYDMPVQARQELGRVYGMDMGQAVAAILNPEKSLPEMNRIVEAARMGGQAIRTGWSLLTQAEMEQLADTGESEAAVGGRLGELAQIGEGLFAETIEEAGAGEDLNRQTQIGYAGGSAAAERQMTSRRQRRAATFQGGGGAAGTGQGRTGLG